MATTGLAIPSGTNAGTYYVCAKADSGSTITEADETNNILCSSTQVTVPLPDLVMTALSTTATSVAKGGSFSLSNATKNQGGSSAGSFAIGFVLSSNTTIGDSDDIALSSQRSVTSRGVGGTSSASTTVTVPLSTPSGFYYIGAITDINNTVTEGSEGNNTRTTTSTIIVP